LQNCFHIMRAQFIEYVAVDTSTNQELDFI
jgi:hypothetical protein